jgi:hypothetical protein
MPTIRGITFALSLIITACHAKTFLTTNPLYYSDLNPKVRQKWENMTWQKSGEVLEDNFPKGLLNSDMCEGAMSAPQPATNAVHAFNYAGAIAMFNKSNNLVLYPLGDIDALFHEYVHARLHWTTDNCKSELLAIALTRKFDLPPIK